MDDRLNSFLCLKCCPRCGGALFRECDTYGCDVECLQCGYIMPKEKLEELIGKDRAATVLQLGKQRAAEQER